MTVALPNGDPEERASGVLVPGSGWRSTRPLKAVRSAAPWGARVGLAWQPFSATPPEAVRGVVRWDPATGAPPPLDATRDAWGVRRSWGWATAQMLAINLGSSMLNEYSYRARASRPMPDPRASVTGRSTPCVGPGWVTIRSMRASGRNGTVRP
jgi:hypothetical protein